MKSQLEYSGMLVKELAARSGVKKKTLDSYLETRCCTPSVDAAVSIAKALGVSVEYLASGEEGAKDRLFSSLQADAQEIALACERMSRSDRRLLLGIARLLRDREPPIR